MRVSPVCRLRRGGPFVLGYRTRSAGGGCCPTVGRMTGGPDGNRLRGIDAATAGERAGRTATAVPSTYRDRLLAELAEITEAYVAVIGASRIEDIDPNRESAYVTFVGYPSWGWGPSDAGLEAARMELLARVREWVVRFRLLFPHPRTPVAVRLDQRLGRLVRWLVRDGNDVDVPSSIDDAVWVLRCDVAQLRELARSVPADEHAARLVVDTNTLIDNPDLAAYRGLLGARYAVHLPPVVLRELGALKRAASREELRNAAGRAERRLKGLRDAGDVGTGVPVAEEVSVVFEHVEPRSDGLPSWLDLSVPADRLVASALLVQSAHPGSAVYVATSELSLQTKLAAVGLPWVEVPGPRGRQP